MYFKFKLSLVATLVVTIFTIAPTVQAVTASDWRPGRIIDDTVFTDVNSMTAAEIQNFLNQRVGTSGNGTPGQCDTNGVKTSELGGGNRAQYGISKNNPPPFTCLKDYYEVPKLNPGPGIPANNYGGAPIPAGAKSAANLIYDAAQAFRISPKVLLITIQKESAGPLITDDWPFRSQYTYAMGAHCPDSGPGGSANCDANYAGFSLQIRESAALMRYYLDNMTQPWWPYKKLGNNSIQFNPNTGCGSTNVFIESSATAALYTYTPYQPNLAALNNMYGTGDGCSAYGNRNFWRMYNDWFGTTLAPSYSWQVVSQYSYTDNAKTTAIDLSALLPGDTAFVGFTARNMGNQTWTNSGNNPVRVGTSSPRDRVSQFCDVSWAGCARAASLKESAVEPGAIGTFEFIYKAPTKPGTYKEYFNLVREGVTWFNDPGLHFNTRVNTPSYTWSILDQYAFTDDTKITPASTQGLKVGQKVFVGFKAKNTGNMTWSNTGPNRVTVGASSPMDRSSRFCDPSWLGCNRPVVIKEATVAPGQIATFEFWYTPSREGTFLEYFKPVVEGITWMNDTGMNFYTTVTPRTYSWTFVNQFAYTDATKTTPVDLTNLTPGQRVFIGFTGKNTGNTDWSNTGVNPVRAGTSSPIDRMSKFCDPTWLGCNRPASLKEATVPPNQNGTFEFWYKAPTAPGVYREYFNPVVEGVTWLNNPGLNFYTVVK